MVDGQTYSSTFVTEAEAHEWLVVTPARAVGTRAARTLTVEAYARRWLGEFIDAAADVDRYRRDVAEHILPALGSRPLVEVTHAEIMAMIPRIGSASSVIAAEQLRATLQELFSDGVDEGIITGSAVPASRRRAQQAGIY